MPQHTVYDLGRLPKGATVHVTLKGNAANVRLLDSVNYAKYKGDRDHRAYGGLVRRSPVALGVPRSGHWYIAVDLVGLRGQVRSSVRVEPPPMAPLRQSHSRISEIAENVADLAPHSPAAEFDVFISHASEDKDDVVRPLARALMESGVSVWYDEFELRIGDSLRRSIDQGIARSRFGLVVVSPSFLGKGWTEYELDGVVTMQLSGKQVLLPIWHDISHDQIVRYSPSLADRYAMRTADRSIDEIAAEIADVILTRTAA